MGQQPKNLVDGNRAGNFSRSCSAHPVANQINARLDGEAVGIFIRGSLAPAVGDRRSRVPDDSRGQEKPPQASLHVNSKP